MKAFPQFTRNYLMEEISYENLMYLLSVIPPYRGLDDDKKNRPAKGINNMNQKKHSHKQITHFNQFGL